MQAHKMYAVFLWILLLSKPVEKFLRQNYILWKLLKFSKQLKKKQNKKPIQFQNTCFYQPQILSKQVKQDVSAS